MIGFCSLEPLAVSFSVLHETVLRDEGVERGSRGRYDS